MDRRIRKQAAIYTLIKYVDENNGSIVINNNMIKRIFNDEDDIVKVEYCSGDIVLLSDVGIEILEGAIFKWKERI